MIHPSLLYLFLRSKDALDKAESRKKVRPDLMFEQGFSEAMLAAVGKSVPDVVEMNYG